MLGRVEEEKYVKWGSDFNDLQFHNYNSASQFFLLHGY